MMAFPYKGYAGKYLRIDLSNEKISKVPLSQGMARDYIGGTGFCAYILWNELSQKTDPLSPENRIIFAVGPLTGAFFPPAGRFVIATKSPLTGIWGESHSGGFFGPELKYAGYDMIVIQGASKKPVYLLIDDDRVELIDASHLWGKDTRETTIRIREEQKDPTIKVACIGQAGENLVKYACVINDFHRAAGRTGMGAVMGSKRLKAVAVKGTKGVDVYDPEGYMEIASEAFSMCTKGKWGEAAEASLGTFGTPNLLPLINAIGRQPTKNHWTGVCDYVEEIGPNKLRNEYRVARWSCFSCTISCKFVSRIDKGLFKGTLTSGPEYETLTSFGTNLLNKDLASIIHINLLCNLYGLDTISAGKVISFAMECYENGIISKEEAGVDLSWGNVETIVELVHKIAKREGFGNVLAEGARKASEIIGKGSEKYAIHVKGLEASAQDGRAHKSIGLTHAISVRGADHLRSLCTVDELGYRDIAIERFGADKVDEITNLLSEKYKGYIVKDQEDFFAIVDSLLVCKYGTMWPPIYYFDFLAKLIPPLTGMKEYADVKKLRLTAERICNLRRAFNTREGITRKDENLHPRFTKEPMPGGPAKGQVVRLDIMLDEYYENRGWDKKTGLPYRKTLERVGLKDVADELEKLGKLAG
jgi:aldehyde:ferredoxin oxidoreductase